MQQILVVSNEPKIGLVEQPLQTAGFRVKSARNRADALKQLEAGTFDLMLLDWQLAGMDSLDLLQQVVKHRPEMGVVVITAPGTVDDAVTVMKAGAIDLIQKPFTADHLCHRITQLLDEAQQKNSYGVYLELARRNIAQYHYAAAKEQVHKAIAQNSARPEAFNLLGAIHDVEGDHHTAMTNYRIALDLDPTYSPARANMLRRTPLPRSTKEVDLG